jgi:hypothetical protein
MTFNSLVPVGQKGILWLMTFNSLVPVGQKDNEGIL